MRPDLAILKCKGIRSTWPRGVTVSTLDSESSDRGSNSREALFFVDKHQDLGLQRAAATQCTHVGSENDTEGIGTPAGRAQWILSSSP